VLPSDAAAGMDIEMHDALTRGGAGCMQLTLNPDTRDSYEGKLLWCRHHLRVTLDMGDGSNPSQHINLQSLNLSRGGAAAGGKAVVAGSTEPPKVPFGLKWLPEFYSDAEKRAAKPKLPKKWDPTVARLAELPVPAAPFGGAADEVYFIGPPGSVVLYQNNRAKPKPSATPGAAAGVIPYFHVALADGRQLNATKDGWCSAEPPGPFAVEKRLRWSIHSNGSAAIIALADGRQLYTNLQGWCAVQLPGTHTNTEPCRRLWTFGPDGIVSLADGRQLYVNRKGWCSTELPGTHTNTEHRRRHWTTVPTLQVDEAPTPAAPCGDDVVVAKVVGTAGSVMHYHNGATGGSGTESVAAHTSTTPVPAVVDRGDSSNLAGVGGDLQTLANLKESGALTEEEFTAAKQQILGLGA